MVFCRCSTSVGANPKNSAIPIVMITIVTVKVDFRIAIFAA